MGRNNNGMGSSTMSQLLQIDFPYPGPFGTDMASQLKGLAESIVNEPGMKWKIWTENAATGTAGGIYLFADRASADAYLTMHSARLASFGITDIRARLFDINHDLTAITHGPLA